MYQGYVGFGGVEVINVARLVAYASRGAVPFGTVLDPGVGPYDAIAAAVGDEDYRTVVLDQPGWYDPTNPDSIDFAGLLPLDITGLEGSTRRRGVTERLGDGGTATRVRATSRTIAVTALAMAVSESGLDAGISWLTGALHPPCAAGVEACGGAQLTLFSAPPVYCDDLPDLDADPIVTDLIPPDGFALAGPSWALTDYTDGVLLDPVCGPVTVTVTAAIDEEVPEDTHRVVVVDLVDSTGAVHASGVLTLPEDGSPATVEVTADPTPGYPLLWQVELHWYTLTADVISGGDAPDPPTDGIASGDADMTDGAWTLITGGVAGPGTVLTDGGALHLDALTLTRQPFLTTEQCLAGLRRSFRNVVTVAGPSVTDRHALNDGEAWAATVEWTWVATDPYPYGDPTNLVTGLLVDRRGAAEGAAEAVSIGNVDIDAPYYTFGFSAGYVGIDGVLISEGGRLVLAGQDDESENGIYVHPGPFLPLVRATDMDTWAEVPDTVVYVTGGLTYAGTTWECTSSPGGTIDVDPITWTTAMI